MKKSIFKKSLAFTMSLLILISGVNISMASDALEEKGSLRIVYKCGGDTTSGVTAKLYRVGNSKYGAFTLAGDFIDAPVELVKVDSNEKWEEVATALEKYAVSNSITPLETKKSNNNGEIVFDELETGLYLVLSEKTSDSKYKYTFEPSIVSIPSKDSDGNWLYDMTIYPKCEKKPRPSNPTDSTEPTDTTETTNPSEPTDTPSKPTTKPGKPGKPGLPSTGLINMAAYSMVGVGLIGLGIISFRNNKND